MRQQKLHADLIALAALACAAMLAHGAEDHSVASVRSSLHLVNPDLTIELAAAEPEIISPVAVAWDEDERMYVVEMRDYPTEPVGGTIRRLEDKDGDGRYEKAVIFADGLPFPSSCLPWRGGLIVTAAPDILYLKDTDGDGRADERRVLLTGFAEGDQQLRVNGLMFGLDGWIYAANGRNGGDVRRAADSESMTISIRRNDIRFKLDRDAAQVTAIEKIAGPSQFGLARDDWGNRFLSWNTIPIRHVVIEERYLNRSPALQGETGIAAIIPEDDIGRVYPLAPPQRRFNRESAEFFNATCGTAIYRGDAMSELSGDAFICESLGSLVHHRKMIRDGSSYTAPRVEQNTEFLASSDPWFRPVNLATGPDGALFVVDFAREWVEHPDYIPKDLREGINFRAGENLGRIWRVRPKEGFKKKPRVRMSGVTTEELANHLKDANGWRRDQAQRLLLERNDRAAIPVLVSLARKSERAETRLAALWTIAALEEQSVGERLMSDELLKTAMNDLSPEVRVGAIEIWMSLSSVRVDLQSSVAKLATDPDMRVRLHVALATRIMERKEGIKILNAIPRAGAMDRWLRMALVSGAGESPWEVVTSITEAEASGEAASAPLQELLEDLSRAAGASNDTGAAKGFMEYCACDGVSEETEMAMLAGYIEGLELRGTRWNESLRIVEANGDLRDTSTGLNWFIAKASIAALSAETEIKERVRAARVLALAPLKEAVPVWLKLIESNQPEEVRTEAARELGRTADAASVETVLASWKRIPASARRSLMVELSRRAVTAGTLLTAAEAGRISVIELRGGAGEALTSHPDAALRARAVKMFEMAGGGDRVPIIARYRGTLTMKGDARKGAEGFARNCIQCHRLQGIGQPVGPDLSGIASRSKEKILSDILDPSLEIAPDYTNYIVVTRSGEVSSGLLARENPAGITLRQAQGVETSIPSGQITEFRAGNVSLMPEGFEEAFDQQAMAGLLEFLHRGNGEMLRLALDDIDRITALR